MNSLEQFILDFKDKKIVVMGLGIQGGGVGVVKFLQKLSMNIIVTDLRPESELEDSLSQIDTKHLELHLGGHREADFLEGDCVIRNPGIPSNNSFLDIAKNAGKPIFMETALFAKYSKSQIVGITGTRGKTTTSTLIYKILSQWGQKTAILAGNIPGKSTLELLENPPDIAVLELSSWQLQGFADLKISPHIAVITNIYPDHLNRYKDMAEYIRDKQAITRHQTQDDFLIYNQDSRECVEIATESVAKKIPFSLTDLGSQVILKLPGMHNRANASAAKKVAEVLLIPEKTIVDSLSSQESIPFRLETRAVIKGITYINDTTSTTPVALITAINTLSQKAIIIVGGQAKNLPTSEMVEVLNNHPLVRGIVLIPGSGTEEIREYLHPERVLASTQNLDEAVREAISHAKEGEIVLFSPGFTSFDQYRNEFERGKHFNEIIAGLT